MSSERKKPKKLVQEAIDKGATTVEEIHTSIADLSLEVLEESDVLKGPVKEVRRMQDHSIGAIYDLIRDINRRVGSLASELLAESTHRRAAYGEGAAKH
jgi:hypothetical protein